MNKVEAYLTLVESFDERVFEEGGVSAVGGRAGLNPARDTPEEKRDFSRHKRLAFIDIDGVLTDRNTGYKYNLPKDYSVSKRCLANLKRVIAEGRLDGVVIASNWRRLGDDRNSRIRVPTMAADGSQNMAYVKSLVPKIIDSLGPSFAGFLPGLDERVRTVENGVVKMIRPPKSAALAEWKKHHPEFKGRYVIFEDDNKREKYRDRWLIETEPEKGITGADVEKALEFLSCR